jgi:hypothetical protein
LMAGDEGIGPSIRGSCVEHFLKLQPAIIVLIQKITASTVPPFLAAGFAEGTSAVEVQGCRAPRGGCGVR